MKLPPPDLSRRTFIRQACCAAVGTTGLLSSLAQLRMLGAVAGDSLTPTTEAAVESDYKALVCIFLSGGNDGTNLVVPSDPSGYAAYAKARAELALPQAQLLSIAPKKYSDGRSYALHPSVPGIQSLYGQGKLALLANVGTLVQPTTLAQYQAGKGLPLQLGSHLDQSIQWQSSLPDRTFETGWGGRLADAVDALNNNNQVSMSITVQGANYFQVGKKVVQFAAGPGGAPDFNPYTPNSFTTRLSAMHAAVSLPQENLLAAAFGNVANTSVVSGAALRTALQTAPSLQTVFPGNSTGNQLGAVAKMISVASALNVKRQIFFVIAGGYDLHNAQLAPHGSLLAELSGAMKSFYDSTVELGVANQVTAFTASDFGRTYVPNAGGTDHGWGNHQLIMGGAVQGGDIYGNMPSLVVGGPDDTGRGRWIPSTSVDEYSATLATWFGVSAANLPVVLPNIGRFAKPNLGFMG
jgi:uncharacterized protein (DUF1501 family)